MWARDIVDDRDYGPKLEYDPQWKGPLQTEREKTDVGFFIALIVYFFIWIGVGIYAFCTGDMQSLCEDFHLDCFSSTSSDVIFITLGFTVLGTCLAFTFLILLRHFPRAVFFTSLVLNIALIVLSSSYFVYMLYEHFEDKEMRHKVTLYTALILSILLAVPTIVCVFSFRKKIFIACGVVKESAKAVLFFPSSCLFPILPFILNILTAAFALCTWACLYENSSTQNGDRPLHLYVLHGINFFGLWWIMNFIQAFSQMVLAGTFATWYWTMDRNQIPNYVILNFIRITMRFHLGTLAFGSLIIAIIEGIRYLLNTSRRRSFERNDLASGIFFFIFECICGLTKDVAEFINTNAYIMCSLHGNNLIQSGKSAFNLFRRNYMKFWAVNCVTCTVLLMGGLLVVELTVSVTCAFCQLFTGTTETVAATLLVLITTGLISTAVFTALQAAIDTIFLCVLEDDERNNGSRERPYFMTPELRQLLMRDQFRIV